MSGKNDAGLAECLVALGAGRVEAHLLACILAESPLPTKDILERTGLRQPEVSVGMRTLRERGWIASEPIPREGKGRPMHRYALATSTEEVYGHYARMAQARMAELREAMQELAGRLPVKAARMDAVAAGDESSVAHA